MKVTCFNDEQLDKVINLAYQKLTEKKAVNISIDDYSKPTTLKQLGFFFGCLASAIRDFFNEGDNESTWTTEGVKDLLCHWLSPKVKMITKTGEVFEHSLHISEMNREQMSKFIDDVIRVIDSAKCFKGLVLHPSIRYCWVHNITPDDLREVDTGSFPRKSPEYLSATRKESCLCCGVYGCEAHHIRESDDAGTSRKADDWEVLPLCPDCHRRYHTQGRLWLESNLHWILKYMSLKDFCSVKFNRWLHHL